MTEVTAAYVQGCYSLCVQNTPVQRIVKAVMAFFQDFFLSGAGGRAPGG